MSFDVARFVVRRLNRGDDELLDRALAVRALPAPGPATWIADRFGRLATTVVTPWKMRFRPGSRALSSASVAYELAMTDGPRESRAFFVRHHFGEEIDFVGRGEERRPAAGPGPWLRWYWLGIGAALMALTDLSTRRYRWLGGLLLDVEALSRALPDIRRVYCFGLYDRRPYLVATFLARHTDVEVVLVFQHIPLYRNCRFLHLDVPVVLTSIVNIPEVEYFKAQGIFRASDVIYRGGEYVADTHMLEPGDPTCDIGYFSSGEWARREGLYQAGDLDSVRAGVYMDNAYALVADRLAVMLAGYARSHGRTLRISPHPFERVMRDKQGIDPPYQRLADGETVTVDWGGENSRSSIYDPRVAVSLQSSFIWERLDLGLRDSYMYEFADRDRNVFLRESLGEYEANVFRDDGELAARLDAALS
ncbi:MAG: hypothetical protein WCQ45_03815 [bacterium]